MLGFRSPFRIKTETSKHNLISILASGCSTCRGDTLIWKCCWCLQSISQQDFSTPVSSTGDTIAPPPLPSPPLSIFLSVLSFFPCRNDISTSQTKEVKERYPQRAQKHVSAPSWKQRQQDAKHFKPWCAVCWGDRLCFRLYKFVSSHFSAEL